MVKIDTKHGSLLTFGNVEDIHKSLSLNKFVKLFIFKEGDFDKNGVVKGVEASFNANSINSVFPFFSITEEDIKSIETLERY